jgi:hypothetical protein
MRITPHRLAGVALLWLVLFLSRGALQAGPYSQALNDPSNSHDAPVPGFVGLDGEGKARLDDGQGGFDNPRNYVNPLFFRWALGWTDYLRADGQTQFSDPSLALGPVTGDNFDVVSLGDLTAAQISSGAAVGRVTTQFTNATQTAAIRNLPGADFVVFENGFVSDFDTGGAGAGGVQGELAYVEVSSDGINFARFPSVSLTPSAVGSFGTLDPTNIFNLAGKHVNAFGDSWGTPFDLSDLTNNPLVLNGMVDLNNIRYVRIVDIPGNGSYFDAATPMAHPIYDPWVTVGSGGFDLEAIGAISIPITFNQWQDLRGLTGTQRGTSADPEQDGVPNLVEYAAAMMPTIPDVYLLPSAVRAGNDGAISFRRDVRAMDLVVEVLGKSDLGQSQWQTLARSTHGADFVAVAPFSPVIDDAADSYIASVGVVRREKIHAPPGIRFLKVSVTLAP